jgi:hypothetical protein
MENVLVTSIDKDNSAQERDNGTLPTPIQQDQNMKTRRTGN